MVSVGRLVVSVRRWVVDGGRVVVAGSVGRLMVSVVFMAVVGAGHACYDQAEKNELLRENKLIVCLSSSEFENRLAVDNSAK